MTEPVNVRGQRTSWTPTRTETGGPVGQAVVTQPAAGEARRAPGGPPRQSPGADAGPGAAQRRRLINERVAVGTALAGGPPRRSQRAELPHWAPTLGAWRRSAPAGMDVRSGSGVSTGPRRGSSWPR